MEAGLKNYIRNMFAMEVTPTWDSSYEGTIFYDKTAKKWITGNDSGWQILDRATTLLSSEISAIHWIDPFEYSTDELLNNNYITNSGITLNIDTNLTTYGNYALKGTAVISGSEGCDLSKHFSPAINTSDEDCMRFDIRSSRVGTNLQLQIYNKQIFDITIPYSKIDEPLIDYPLPVEFTDDDLFTILSTSESFYNVTTKSVIIDIADAWGTVSYVGIRSIEFVYNGEVIEITSNDITCYATTSFNADYAPDQTFDTTLSKTNTFQYAQWLATAGSITNQRLVCVFDSEQTFDKIIINNGHHNGTITNTGAKNAKIYIASDTITSTVYGEEISNATLIFDGVFPQHIASNIVDDQELSLQSVCGITYTPTKKFKIEYTIPEEHDPVLLIHSDTTDGSVVFNDSSIFTHTITAYGSTHHETDQVKFGKTSIYFDGTGDYLKTNDSVITNTQDTLTIDTWVYPTTSNPNTVQGIIIGESYPDEASSYWSFGLDSNDRVIFRWWGGSSKAAISINTVSLNIWTHIAITVDSGVIRLFINGNNEAITGDTTLTNRTGTYGYLTLGANNNYYYTGYIDELRITKGIALWTSNFIPPWRAAGQATGVVQCPVEIEYWNTVDKKAVIHTKVPYISDIEDTVLKLTVDELMDENTGYVGDTGSTTAQSVWDSNFKAVYHMNQDPSGGTECILDSTSNNNNGTPGGSMTSGDLIDVGISKGIDFDGVNDYINLTGITTDSTNTIEMGVKFIVSGVDSYLFDIEIGRMIVGIESSENTLKVYDGSWRDSSLVVANNVQHQIASVGDGVSRSIYVDGSEYNVSGIVMSIGGAISIGGRYDGSGNFLQGTINEVRVSDIARSDAWIKATNYSLSNNLITITESVETYRSSSVISPLMSHDIHIDKSNTYQAELVNTASISGSYNTLSFKVLNDDLENTFYIDNMYFGVGSVDWLDPFEYPTDEILRNNYITTNSGVLTIYSEDNIKTYGDYSLKGIAIDNSTGESITKELSPNLNINNISNIKFDIRAYRVGSNIQFQLYNGGSFYTAKSVILDIATNFGGDNYVGIRSVDFYDSVNTLIVTGYIAYSTSNYATTPPSGAFDTTRSKTGLYSNNAWMSNGSINQRLICVFTTPQTLTRIVINTHHHSGGETLRGANAVKINISDDAITSTVYNESIANATLVFDGNFTQHVASDIIDDQELQLETYQSDDLLTHNINITTSGTFQTETWDVTTASGTYETIAFEVINDDLENTFYIDNMYFE